MKYLILSISLFSILAAPAALAQSVRCQSADQCPKIDVCINVDSNTGYGICGKCKTDANCVLGDGSPAKEGYGTHCDYQGLSKDTPGGCVFQTVGGTGASGMEGAGTESTTKCTSSSQCPKDWKCDIATGGSEGFCISVQLGPSGIICDKDTDCGNGQVCHLGSCAAPFEPEAAAAPAAPALAPFIEPTLSFNIPNLSMPDFTKVTEEDGYIFVPFIAVYLAAVYKLGVALAAVLAVIMIMIGGIRRVVAAGNAAQIGESNKMIVSAVTGLILTVGVYTALQVVNPDLLKFNALKIQAIGRQELKLIEDYQPETEGDVAVGGAPSQYDSIFAKYAPCAGVTPEVLKAIATAESGLNAGKVNKSGYVGLFQTKAVNCPSVVRSYCPNDAALTDPDNNTAVGAAMIKKTVSLIAKKCPTAGGHDQMVMIYISHNMGYGMLQTVLDKTCDAAKMRQATIDAYAEKWPGTASSYSKKYQAACLGSNPTPGKMAECTGGPKFDYALRIANKFGGSQVLASGGTCPY